MQKELRLSQAAASDIDNVADFILHQYGAPLASKRFTHALRDYLESIAGHPEIYPLNYYEQLRHYGSSDMRKTSFRKKWIILFNF